MSEKAHNVSSLPKDAPRVETEATDETVPLRHRIAAKLTNPKVKLVVGSVVAGAAVAAGAIHLAKRDSDEEPEADVANPTDNT